MKIRSRLFLSTIGGSAILFGAVGVILNHLVSSSLEEQMIARMQSQVGMARDLCEASFADRKNKVSHDVKVYSALAQGHLGEGNALVDRIKSITGDYATLFAVTPDGITRTATTVKKEDGSRAVGTSVPTSSPVYQTVMAGNDYVGRATVVGQDYIVAYSPLRGSSGKVEAVLFVGVPEVDRAVLREKLLAAKSCENGFTYALDSSGVLIIHPRDEGKDISGESVGKTMLSSDSGVLRYQPSGKEQNVWKRTVYVHAPSLGWTIATTVPESAIFATATHLTIIIILSILVVIGVFVGISLWIDRSVAAPIRRASEIMKNIAHGEGDLTQRLHIASEDELGELATQFNAFAEKTRASIATVRQHSITVAGSSSQLDALAGSLDKNARTAAEKSNTVAAAAEEMSSGATTVAASVEQSSANLERIAAAVEEMNASIKEIASSSESSRATTEEAYAAAQDAANLVGELANASTEIGKVVEFIVEISEQTKLLALNATIEAARAGEAGKGFAVVAGEVKDLAKGTADATGQISERVKKMRDATDAAVQRITRIHEVIGQVTDVQRSISASVEQQSAATHEITANLSETVTGIHEVSRNVSEVANAAGSVARDIVEIRATGTELESEAKTLRHSSDELSASVKGMQSELGHFKTE